MTNSVAIKVTGNKQFPYNARDVLAAIGITGDFTTQFKDYIIKFNWEENADHTLLEIQEPVAGHQGGGSVRVHDYYITEEAALQIAMSSRKPKALVFAKHIIKQLKATRAALKEIEEKGYERVKGKEVRNVFTDSIKSLKSNASPADYIQATYETKAYLGIACNKKKDDYTQDQLCRTSVAETLAALKINELKTKNEDALLTDIMKGATQLVENYSPCQHPDLFYDKSHPSKGTLRDKIIELINIAAATTRTKHEIIWNKVYLNIYKLFNINIAELHERAKRADKTITKVDIIVDYGVASMTHPDYTDISFDLGEWVLDYLNQQYTQKFNPKALIAYTQQKNQITRPVL